MRTLELPGSQTVSKRVAPGRGREEWTQGFTQGKDEKVPECDGHGGGTLV